jgi:hypothetical protein
MNPTNVDLKNAHTVRKLTVFYHDGCPDGISGAWSIYWAFPPGLRRELQALGGIYADGRTKCAPRAQLAIGPVFLGVTHGDGRPAPKLVVGRHVVYVDITPAAEDLLWVASQAATLTLLDHHRSALPALEAVARDEAPSARGGAARVVVAYDEARAGAQLAWDWAHSPALPGPPGLPAGPPRPRPQIIDYVADRDLYTFRLPGARAACKTLYVEGYTRGFGPLTRHMEGAGGAVDGAMIERGAVYLRYEEKLVSGILAHAQPVVVAAHLPGEVEPREYCALAINTTTLLSEVGAAAMDRAPPEVHFAVVWTYCHARDEIRASVRTNRPDVDLSQIAPHVVGAASGGGHPGAAAFIVPGCNIGAVLRPAAAAASAPQ